MATPVKVKKWGSSMAVLLPNQFAKMRHIAVGSVIDIDAVKVIKKRRRYTLAELAAKLKPEHRHGEWNLGGPAGREVW